MGNLSSHVYTENGKFYFDTEVYSEDGPQKALDYEDGDMIKWFWEGKKMSGILRQSNADLGLFSIENISTY